jgi:signal transduction histidine kinase
VVISTKGTGYETGYGLGLYITAQLMQKIGGKVVAENNINGTCTFTLYFNNKADAGYSTTG